MNKRKMKPVFIGQEDGSEIEITDPKLVEFVHMCSKYPGNIISVHEKPNSKEMRLVCHLPDGTRIDVEDKFKFGEAEGSA